MTIETTETSPQLQAEAITSRYAAWAAGAGLIPIPLVDMAAITTVQLKMLREIAGVYHVEFAENRGKSIVLSLVGGIGSTALAIGFVGSLAKIVPGIGSILGVATLPAFAGAITYATGKVFTQHFESGGTFLSFNTAEAQAAFKQEFARGKAQFEKTAGKVETKLDALVDKVTAR